MLYFLAIFCSPMALVFAGKPFQALANFVLYGLSILLWATIIFNGAGFLLWALGFIHAVLAISDAHEDRRARRITAAMDRRY